MSKKTREERKACQQLTRHHLQCKSNGGSNDRKNISYVTHIHHNSWHTLFSNLLPPVICQIINHKWLDGRWRFICVKTKDYEKIEQQIKLLIDE